MKTLVVTGYSSRFVEQLLARIQPPARSLRIVTCGRRDDADLWVDFAQLGSVRDFIVRLREISPDYLFVNHGMLPGKPIGDLPDELIADSVNVNLTSYLLIMEAIKDVANLRTVVMSSISGKRGSYDTLYGACKAGVDLAIRQFAPVLPPSSRLNGVSPGIILDTKMTQVREDTDVLEATAAKTPTGKFGMASDVARLVEYLLFEAENMTGENVNLNGGLYIR